MNLIYSGQFKDIVGKSIFLAGPAPREGQVLLWREFAIKYFEKFGFDGTLIIPEPEYGTWIDYDGVIEWEDKYLNECDLIMFWVCRDIEEQIYGLTTNVEFGRFLNSGKIVYGRPDHSDKNRYLDYWYKKIYGQDPENRLENLCLSCVVKLEKGDTD